MSVTVPIYVFGSLVPLVPIHLMSSLKVMPKYAPRVPHGDSFGDDICIEGTRDEICEGDRVALIRKIRHSRNHIPYS